MKEINPKVEQGLRVKGMGWLCERPSIRDYSPSSKELPERARAIGLKETVASMHKRIGIGGSRASSLPNAVDLRTWCSPIEDQETIGSCTANAAVGLVEYFERRAFGRYSDASRLFIYKATRNLMHVSGDEGAYLRTTMGALALFGAPPEEYWPYDISRYDLEPPAFCYAFGQSYQSILYYRLDPLGTSPGELLTRIKTYLAAGLPSMFGFTVYSSMEQAGATGKIPFPVITESVLGGHAMVVVGYDDTVKITNSNPGASPTTGAFIVRNSWGTSWGPYGGYLWLPYKYVLEELADDWWSVLKNEWVDLIHFKP